MARRKLSAKQIRAGFGGKAAKASTRRQPTMARKQKRRGGGRRRSGRMMGMNTGAIIDGAIGAAGAGLGNGLLGEQYGPGAGLLAAGVFRKNDVLQTLAGVSLGSAILSGFSGATGGIIKTPAQGVL